MAATKCFHLATASFNKQPNNNNSARRKEQLKFSGRKITLQIPSLDPRFAIIIDLCACDFQVVESFTVQVNQLIDA